jgi:hypothetical protein
MLNVFYGHEWGKVPGDPAWEIDERKGRVDG